MFSVPVRFPKGFDIVDGEAGQFVEHPACHRRRLTSESALLKNNGHDVTWVRNWAEGREQGVVLLCGLLRRACLAGDREDVEGEAPKGGGGGSGVCPHDAGQSLKNWAADLIGHVDVSEDDWWTSDRRESRDNRWERVGTRIVERQG